MLLKMIGGKVLGALFVLLILGALFLKYKSMVMKIHSLEDKLTFCQSQLAEQRQQTKMANAAIEMVNTRYQKLSDRTKQLQNVQNKAIAHYRTLLMKCMKRKPEEKIIIRVVKTGKCPSITFIEEGDPLLDRLNGRLHE